MTYKPTAEYIGDIVDKVRAYFANENGAPFYDYGTTLEVVNRLVEKEDNPSLFDKKYPLIWFVIDDTVKEEVNLNQSPKRKAVEISIIFCMETSAEYTSKERYTNTILPVLRPLYEKFMYYLTVDKYLNSSNGFQHDYHENLYWGRNGVYGHDGNIFNDSIDAIIIENLELLINNNC